MQIQLRQPAELLQAEIAVWQHIVRTTPDFHSPYFHPQFTMDVASVRDDVEVAVLSDADAIIGFFPFQRTGRTARPVGGMLSDAHGVIAADGIDIDYRSLLTQCGLVAWNYHYQIESQIPGPEWQPDVELAAIMNLAGGFDAYRARLQSKSMVSQTDRKARKLAREQGAELRFEWDSRDENAFALLKQWKSQQYAESSIADVFSFDWTEELLDRIWKRSSPDYEGLLSVLYLGDRPIAVHFGLRADRVLHQWFPGYDPELNNYSPGLIHLLEMARHAQQHDVDRIDLGRLCHYKSRVATSTVNVAEGSIDLRPVTRMLKRGYEQTFEWLRHSPLRTVARVPGRMLRQLIERQQFQ